MISQRVTLIDQGRQVVATAQVAGQDGSFTGRINLSLLDEIEEKVEALHLKAVFEDGYEATLTDVQIYPSTNKVSFQALKGVVSHPPKRG